MTFSQDFAGLGGDVSYLRTRVDATKYHGFGGGWVLSAHGEGGYIKALQTSPGPGRDAIRLTDRFFGPQLRGFDIRGIGPRILRFSYNADGTRPAARASKRPSPTRWAARPIIWAGSSSSSRQLGLAQRRPAAVGVHRRRFAVEHHAGRS